MIIQDIMIDKLHSIILKRCEFTGNYFYNLYKGNELVFKQRTALTTEDIIKEVKNLIAINKSTTSSTANLALFKVKSTIPSRQST